MMDGNIILRTEKLCKSFGPTKANIDIDFTLNKGEIRGLVGENGSGKSTLLSQIAGVYASDSGVMYLDGEIYNPQSPLDAYAHKIGTVVQEFGMIGALPAGVNVFLGRMQQYMKGGIINMRKMMADIRELARRWDLADVPLGKNAGTLNVETRKQVELLRALALDPDILILDEITQALSHDNRQRLYGLIHKFKEMGRSVLVISHDLDEIVDLADNLTVLRDGKIVDTVSTEGLSMSELKRLMIGRELVGEYYRTDNVPSYNKDIVLSVNGLSVRDEVKDLSFDLHAGEILGFCGLSDSGIHTIGKALYGLEYDAVGTVTLMNSGVQIKNPKVALESGMAYVPKERDGEGLMIQADIRCNLCLTQLDNLRGKLGMLWPRKLSRAANKSREEFSIRCRDIFQEVGSLSGGNKQKVNLGRWLAKNLSIIVLDCPTRGVDIGVKSYIYNLMKDLKKTGLGIVLISDELLEVIGLADRIIVVNNGKVVQEVLRGPEFSEEAIIEVML